jgi:hypothetical protein
MSSAVRSGSSTLSNSAPTSDDAVQSPASRLGSLDSNKLHAWNAAMENRDPNKTGGGIHAGSEPRVEPPKSPEFNTLELQTHADVQNVEEKVFEQVLMAHEAGSAHQAGGAGHVVSADPRLVTDPAQVDSLESQFHAWGHIGEALGSFLDRSNQLFSQFLTPTRGKRGEGRVLSADQDDSLEGAGASSQRSSSDHRDRSDPY